MTKYLCPKAWTEIAISPSGLITPCCVYETPLKGENGEFFHISKNTIEEVWNSQSMKEIRIKMLSGEEVSGCRQCIGQEKRENKSKRLESINELKDFRIKVDYNDIKDGEITRKPISLDLKLGNKCNLACRMCQPKDSSIVAKEFKKIIKKDESFKYFQNTVLFDPHLIKNFDEIENWADSKNFRVQVTELSNNIENLNVAGGEPLIQKEFIKLLDIFIKNGKSKKCRIFISTNLTVLPRKITDRLLNFNNVHFGVSMDGVEEVQEYIRYPIKWNKFTKNLEEISILQRRFNIFSSSLCITVQIYNIENIDKIIMFYYEYLLKYFKRQRLGIYFHVLEYPSHLSVKILPNSVKILLKEKILNAIDQAEELKNQPHFQSEIQKVLGALEVSEHKSENQLKLFNKYTESIDEARKSSFREISPALCEQIEDAISNGGVDPRPDLGVIMSYAWAKQQKNELADAEFYFKKALEQGKEKDSLSGLAYNYYLQENFEKSSEVYLELNQLVPNDKTILTSTAWALQYANKLKEAEDFFKKALECEKNKELLGGLAHNYYLQQNFDKSIETYLEMKEIEPLDLIRLKSLAWVYKDSGNRQESLKYFYQAREIDAQDPDVKREITWLEQI